MASLSKPWGLVAIGLVLALAGTEVALRIADDSIPMRSEWPTPEAELKYQHLRVEGRDPDIVLFGSSFVEAAVDPEQMMSGEAYNLAMPFTTVQTIEWWLDDVVLEVTNPRLIVIGVPVWADPDATDGDIAAALSRASRRETSVGGALRLAQAVGALGQMDQTLARERLIEADVWTDYGFQTGYFDKGVPRSSWETRSGAVLEGRELEALRGLIHLAASDTTEVALLIEPLAGSIAPGPADLERFSADLAALAAETGAVLLEPPDDFWEDDRYVDGIHLNADAADEFSRYVDNLVVAIGVGSAADADEDLRVSGR